MAELIQLNITTRNTKPAIGLYGFDIDDIIVPIRFNSNNNTHYFTARQLKGTPQGHSHNNGRADYIGTDTLASIASQSDDLLLLTVKFRRGKDMLLEKQIFVASHISENLTPTPILGLGTGTSFYYCEDGDPSPVQYTVTESVATIVAMSSSGGGGGSPITTISYDMAGTGLIDLTGYFGEMIINLTDSIPGNTLNNITNGGGVTKITIYTAITPLTINDGALNIKLDAPVLTVLGNKSGFIELTKRSGKFFQTNYIDQYN